MAESVIVKSDFKTYLGLLVDSGKRSRTILIFIVILSTLSVASLRNDYYPGWTLKRLELRELVYDCYDSKKIFSPSCVVAMDRINKAVHDSRQDCPNNLRFDEQHLRTSLRCVGFKLHNINLENHNNNENIYMTTEKEEIIELAKKWINLHQFSLQLIGGHIDADDFWLMSGVVMAFLLFFFKQSVSQERRIIEDMSKLEDNNKSILLHSQVLFAFHNDVFFNVLIRFMLIMIPTGAYAFLLLDDLNTTVFFYLWIKKWPGLIPKAEVAVFFVLLAANIGAFLAQERLIKTVGKLKVQPSEASDPGVLRKIKESAGSALSKLQARLSGSGVKDPL